ncbi:WD40 repeat-like protein [Suillus decipiens]|nr:WD40 repeat-like protein [Suillus decipiens]
MGDPASAKHKKSTTLPHRKIEVKNGISKILHPPGGQWIVTYSRSDRSLRVWDLERGMQVGEEWEDKDGGITAMASSPDGKTVTTGSSDGVVKLWNVNTGKVIKTLAGHTEVVQSVCWSPDGGRVVSGSVCGTFITWDVKSGETIIGPINAGEYMFVVCYSSDGKMIATGGGDLRIWDANTGELFKTIDYHNCACLAWSSDGKTLFANESKIDTATWTVLDVRHGMPDSLSFSPNERILATTSYWDKTAQLWNTKNNQPIGTPIHHENQVISATFSADGKFLVTSCDDDDGNVEIYIWDVSVIIKEAGLPSDIVDVTPRPALKIKGATRIPPGFFDDGLREANLRIRLSQSNGPHHYPTAASHQCILGVSSFWHRSKRATERDIQSRSRPFSWNLNLSGMLRRPDASEIQLQEVEVPYTAGKLRNYHAGKKKAPNSSRPPNTHTTQPNAATQSTPPALHVQQPPLTSTASPLLVVPGIMPTTETISSPRVTINGWRARLVGWLCCVPIQHTDGQP